MNRRGFLQKAIGAAGALALGASILPEMAKAKEIEKVDIGAIHGGEGGYIIPSEYAGDLEALIRRDYAEQIALSIDKEVLRGTSSLEPVGLLNHNPAMAIGKVQKIAMNGSKLVAKIGRTR